MSVRGQFTCQDQLDGRVSAEIEVSSIGLHDPHHVFAHVKAAEIEKVASRQGILARHTQVAGEGRFPFLLLRISILPSSVRDERHIRFRQAGRDER